MNRVIARSLELQRLLLRSSVSIATHNASKPEKFLDDLSEELRDKLPVYTFPDFQIVVEDPVVAGGRKRKLKDRRKSQEKAPEGLRPLAEVTCFFCKLKGHYANHCPKKLAATSRSLPALLLPWVPASQSGCPRNMADVTCFFCGQKGHYASHCPEKAGAAPRPKGGRGQGSDPPPDLEVVQKAAATSPFLSQPVMQSLVPARQPGGLRNLADVTCFSCNHKGHYANNCPLKQQKIACTRSSSVTAGKSSGDN